MESIQSVMLMIKGSNSLFYLQLYNTYKYNAMKKIELTREDLKRLQHILDDYMTNYNEHMSKQYYDVLESLTLKLTVMRAQMEYLKLKEE